MFRCDSCRKVVEPKQSPVAVVQQTRNVDYMNEFDRFNEDKNETEHIVVESAGWEIVKEAKVCPDCAEPLGIPKRSVSAVERKGVHTFAEPLPKPMRTPFVATAVHNTLERLSHAEKNNQRAKRDCAIAIPLIKGFVDTNKDFIF